MKTAILHLQHFGINVDDTWPKPNADRSYPNGDDDNADTEKPDEIDENKEMLADAKDSELAKRFWDERP